MYVILHDTRNGQELRYPKYQSEEDYFLWTDGNYGCDCNRSLFMHPNDEDKQLQCNKDKNVITARFED